MHLGRSVQSVKVPTMFLQNVLLILDQSTHRDSVSLVLLVLQVLVMRNITSQKISTVSTSKDHLHMLWTLWKLMIKELAVTATDYSSSDYDACMISIERPHGSVKPSEIELHNVHDVKCSKKYEKKILATMALVGNPYPVTMRIDSGAECNVLPERFLPPNSIVNKTTSKLKLYNSETKLDILGVVNLKVGNPKNDKVYTIPFNVIHGARSMPLLGAYTS